jgi:S1-C subfamily serine protease
MTRGARQFAWIAICLYSISTCAAVTAPRFAVPILCTENPSARTKTLGTAIIVDAAGTILTAAHVLSVSQVLCTLTVIVPRGDWSRGLGFHVFSLKQCASNPLLDIALCHIEPMGAVHDRIDVVPARIAIKGPLSGSAIIIPGFTGWGLLPTILQGHILTPQQLYRREDGCYCDFAVDVVAKAGMSGSPLVTDEGKVVGLITLAGTGKFRGISFGTSFEAAASFLRKNGLNSLIE